MDGREVIEFIEDKDVLDEKDWFLHATDNNFKVISSILKDGIKCAYLRDDGLAFGFNGRYYISLYQNNFHSSELIKRFDNNVKIIIDGINPRYAKRSRNIRYFFIDTRIPLRTSEYNGEYQQYLEIDPKYFVGLDYHLSRTMLHLYPKEMIRELDFVKGLVYCVNETNNNLPIYDLSSHKELNKEKILSLKL